MDQEWKKEDDSDTTNQNCITDEPRHLKKMLQLRKDRGKMMKNCSLHK